MFWGTEEKPKKLGKSKLTKTTKMLKKDVDKKVSQW